MRKLMAPELLEVWERGASQSPVERALTLLGAACPEQEGARLAALSIGRRDGLLLSVRESAFGPRVTAVTGCPACSEELEFGFANGLEVTTSGASHIDPGRNLLRRSPESPSTGSGCAPEPPVSS